MPDVVTEESQWRVEVRKAAFEAADAAARRANVTVRSLATITEMHEAVSLFSELWKAPADSPEMSHDLLKALTLAGNYVAGAFEADPSERLVGAAVAFASVRPDPKEPELHSHVTGALPGRLGSGIGFALKLHQRSWALEHGIGVVTWTFDPLVRRNAVFNLAKLGASVTAYLRDVYGTLADALNLGGESDRLWARWLLSEPSVVEAAAGSRQIAGSGSLPCRLAPDENLRPRLGRPDGGRRFTVSIPADIEALRRDDPALARDWRVAVRDVLGGALEEGGHLVGVDGGGDFVVEEGEA